MPRVHVHGNWHEPDEIQLDQNGRMGSWGNDFQTRNLGTRNPNSMHWSWLADPTLGVSR